MEIREGYYRVTDILFPFSGLTQVNKEILRMASERGTAVHQVCDAIINHLGQVEINIKWKGYIESFNKWFPEKEFIDNPQRFYCDDLKITGECDGIFKNEKGLTIVDFKTSSKESKTWALQGSAYSYLAKKYGYNITKILFVKLSKVGEYPEVFEYEENFDLFAKCLEIYKYFFNNVKEVSYE